MKSTLQAQRSRPAEVEQLETRVVLKCLGEPLAAPVGHVALLQVELFERAVHLWRKQLKSLLSVLVVRKTGTGGRRVARMGKVKTGRGAESGTPGASARCGRRAPPGASRAAAG